MAGVSVVACSKTPSKPVGGLEVIIAADGLSAPTDFDDIRLEVSQQSDGGNWNKLWDRDYVVPSQEATLPTTFAVIAGQSTDQEVLISVTAFKGGSSGQPVVQRVAQVQAPTDRVAALWLVLAQVCRGQVALTGAEGEPVSTCPTGQSCQPSTGGCGSSAISDPGGLPTYLPGETLDATPEGSVVVRSGDAEADGGRTDAGADGGGTSSGGSGGSSSGSGTSSGSSSSSGAGGSASSSGGGTDGGGATPLSCVPGGGAGMSNCGPGGSGNESCCTSLEVPSGTYYRTYDPIAADGGVAVAADGGPVGEADPASVSGFRLDKYLVTVGRFRQFVNAVLPSDGGTGWLPMAGSGKHTHLNSGNGLARTGGGFEAGWVTTDNINIEPANGNLTCDASFATWTNPVSNQENLPIDCVNWFESYAFCIWDGGFLPSEAEWEYAAAGGSQQREYPWGSTAPATGNQYAIYECDYPNGSGKCSPGAGSIAPVGTATLGAGLWGQLDLAGNMVEWNLDWYGDYVNPCTDCADITASPITVRVVRGGYFIAPATGLLASTRYTDTPTARYPTTGFRCARTP